MQFHLEINSNLKKTIEERVEIFLTDVEGNLFTKILNINILCMLFPNQIYGQSKNK